MWLLSLKCKNNDYMSGTDCIYFLANYPIPTIQCLELPQQVHDPLSLSSSTTNTTVGPWVHSHYSVDSLMWMSKHHGSSGVPLKRPGKSGCAWGKQVFLMCMKVARSPTVTPLCLFDGESVAQLASSLLSDWLAVGAAGKCLSSSLPCRSHFCFHCGPEQKSVLFSIPQAFFIASTCEESFSWGNAEKSLKQQLDFIW